MEWIDIKKQLPGTEVKEKNKVLLVYKIGNCSPDIAWFISNEDYFHFCIGSDTKQTYQPDFWCEITFPNSL